MSKEVQMSIKMEAELHKQFMALAAELDMPAAQIVRQLMRHYLARLANKKTKVPNATSLAAMEELQQGKGKRFANADALFHDLGI